MNIAFISEFIVKITSEDLCVSLELIQGMLNITVYPKEEECVYSITLFDVCENDYYGIHVKNGSDFRKWILKCVLTNHIRIDKCLSRRRNDDSPLILFTWDDNYVDRLEIPKYLIPD